jgi:hypothetical protein
MIRYVVCIYRIQHCIYFIVYDDVTSKAVVKTKEFRQKNIHAHVYYTLSYTIYYYYIK